MDIKRLLLSNDLKQLNSLHDFLDTVGCEFGICPHTMMSLKLALEEAVVNVISYAYPSTSTVRVPHAISLELEKSADKLLIHLIDDGIPFNPLVREEPDITLTAEERPIGGLGIFLVKQLMSDVTYIRAEDKNILTMIKDLP